VIDGPVAVLRLLLAAVLGGIVGLERESAGRPAGFRTHMLVAVGAALVMIVSLHMPWLVRGASGDPGRIAAQVVSGIGFLGAGTILREGATVRGLTTAASLWVVAGVGLAVGAGFFFEAVSTTVIVFLALFFLTRLEGTFITKRKFRTLSVVARDEPGQLGRVASILGSYRVNIKGIKLRQVEGACVEIQLHVEEPRGLDHARLTQELYEADGIMTVEQD